VSQFDGAPLGGTTGLLDGGGLLNVDADAAGSGPNDGLLGVNAGGAGQSNLADVHVGDVNSGLLGGGNMLGGLTDLADTGNLPGGGGDDVLGAVSGLLGGTDGTEIMPIHVDAADGSNVADAEAGNLAHATVSDGSSEYSPDTSSAIVGHADLPLDGGGLLDLGSGDLPVDVPIVDLVDIGGVLDQVTG
jgi:hypothetical protein